jgi:hypothetical protein
MLDVVGSPIAEPAEVAGAQTIGNPGRAEVTEFLESEVGVGGIVEFVGAVGGGKRRIGILGQPIDDVAEVAVDASGGLGGVDLAVVEDAHFV